MSEAPETKEDTKLKVRNEINSQFLTYKYLLAASLAALIISTFASWFFYSRWNEAEDRYAVVLLEKTQLNEKFDRLKADFDTYLNDFLIIKEPYSTVFQLESIDSAKQYICKIYWNRLTKDVYIDAINLPASDDYHLWAKSENNQPFDCGKFNGQTEVLQHMRKIESVTSWAVNQGDSAINPLLKSTLW